MIFTHRRARESEEGESYYISMTDMMVGVVFIFIIMLSYFALHYRETTAAVTAASDKQTVALLQVAGPMDTEHVAVQVDHKNMIVCLPGSVLVTGEADDNSNRHCFAYSNTVAAKEEVTAAQDQLATELLVGIGNVPVSASKVGSGTVGFPASQLFIEGTNFLTPEGQKTVETTAASLVKNLPCYGYGAPTNCTEKLKVNAIYVATQMAFDPFTPEGRSSQELAVERAVAFHDAMLKAEPQLQSVASKTGPLLRVSANGHSLGNANTADEGRIALQFEMEH